MTASHLVALKNLSLLSNIDSNQLIHARRKQQQVSNLWPQTICIPLINERKIIHGNLTHSNAAPFGTHVAYLN